MARSELRAPPAEAISLLYETHRDAIFRLGLRMLDGNPADAEDLVQSTFLHAYAGWDRFEGRSSAGTWLHAIAIRTALRMRRRRAGQPRDMAPLDENTEPSENLPSPGPLEDVIESEAAERLRVALETLPIRYRLPLDMHTMGDVSVHEIAEILHVSDGTVKSRLARARGALSNRLRGPNATGRSEGEGGPRRRRRSRALDLCPQCRRVFGEEAAAERLCECLERGACRGRDGLPREPDCLTPLRDGTSGPEPSTP